MSFLSSATRCFASHPRGRHHPEYIVNDYHDGDDIHGDDMNLEADGTDESPIVSMVEDYDDYDDDDDDDDEHGMIHNNGDIENGGMVSEMNVQQQKEMPSERSNSEWNKSHDGTRCLAALFLPTSSLSSSPSSSSLSTSASTQTTPGLATVTIQVGDVGLARKAWKKRRRSGSPMLVPCSILQMDLQVMAQNNLMYLLYKYGLESKTSRHRSGLEISLSELSNLHRKQFRLTLSVGFNKCTIIPQFFVYFSLH
jgi:hypothetical protein